MRSLVFIAMAWAALAMPFSAYGQDPRQPEYEAALQRLRAAYTLGRVEREGIEVTYDDLKGMATLLSSAVPVHVPLAYEPIFVQPDLSVALGKEEQSLEVGFALGEPAALADFYTTRRALDNGYLPICTNQWDAGPLEVRETVFGFLPEDDEIVTGKEKQYAFIRIALRNTTREPVRMPLLMMVGYPDPIIRIGIGTAGRKNGFSHWPFTAWPGRWQRGELDVALKDHHVLVKGRAFLSFHASPSVTAAFHKRLEFPGQNDSLHPQCLENCMRFDLNLPQGGTQLLDMVAAAETDLFDPDDFAGMDPVTFEQARARQEAYCQRFLRKGMRYEVPEPRLNTMHQALVLSCLGMMAKNPKHDWLEAYQASDGWESDPWEQAFMLIPMMKAGYAEDARRCLKLYIDRQMGIGPDAATAEQGYGPPAATSFTGTYPGLDSIDWMNNTGCVLWMMAEYYLLTGDRAWLEGQVPSIQAAWRWIQNERAQSRILDDHGQRVRHYGLITPGRAGDISEGSYIYTFTDSYTWLGMHTMAQAFTQAGLPGAGTMAEEAAEYRQCILDVMHQEEFVDPATGLRFVPSMAYWRKGETRDPYWHAHGPMQLLATGLLAPEDERFAPMLEYIDRTTGTLLGFAEYFPDHWYAGQIERTYYQCYLARGEFEKALLTFYSCMNYAVSSDVFQTAERNNMLESNFRPYMNNGSGIGRLLDMLQRAVLDDQDSEKGVLWLLRGCPRPWFESGKQITLENVLTQFGTMSLRAKSHGDNTTMVIDAPDRVTPAEFRIAIHHPTRQPLSKATVNGRPAQIQGDAVVVPQPRGRVRVRCEY